MELKDFSRDPVFAGGEFWYFWDETWSTNYGPYDSEAQARSELRLYCHYLNGNLPCQINADTKLYFSEFAVSLH